VRLSKKKPEEQKPEEQKVPRSGGLKGKTNYVVTLDELDVLDERAREAQRQFAKNMEKELLNALASQQQATNTSRIPENVMSDRLTVSYTERMRQQYSRLYEAAYGSGGSVPVPVVTPGGGGGGIGHNTFVHDEVNNTFTFQVPVPNHYTNPGSHSHTLVTRPWDQKADTQTIKVEGSQYASRANLLAELLVTTYWTIMALIEEADMDEESAAWADAVALKEQLAELGIDVDA
jgi:hypothetical protein